MREQSNPVGIKILDKEYMITCPEDEKEALVASARYLDRRMKEARDGGKVLGTERMAVMTALNIVHDLLIQQKEKDDIERDVGTRVKNLEEKIDVALGRRIEAEQVD